MEARSTQPGSALPVGTLAPDGRDPSRVPQDWQELLDPTEWVLNEEGLPSRRAARVIALRRGPEPAILLVTGHDFGDEEHRWAFTPGGGILAGESAQQAALRELAEETGVVLRPEALSGPVLRRTSLFVFHLVTCRQEEEIFLAHLEPGEGSDSEQADGEMERSGWTDLEREVLDSLRWWTLAELDEAVAAGMTVYPKVLPSFARDLLDGWDGVLRQVREED